ncbi:uncharacterized protein LOC143047767 isoform X2 [Mytilus galloprovincialis]|uniref:uncharacterized protein LOC143047767 isoform X2 n=1 Tax=Mytilus galloprovincialis TaxID=29158 RepID=UPI003F7C3E46
MLSPLSRGFGTWTGNYDPYNEDGAESDTSFCSLPGIEEPHRHGITVGFVSRTPSATLISPPYGRTSSHAREATLSASTHYAREATLSGKRNGPGREVLFADPMSRENSDSQMNLPKTFLTRKGALMLFAADEGELDSLTSRTDVQPRVMRIRKPVDVIDTSLKLGTMDKLAMSVLQFGEEEIPKENSNVTDEKNKMFMKFLNKVDDRDVDKRAQPGGDVKYYLSDLKHKTSLQMGLSGDTALPRNREALELRAILLGLQGDGSWPMTYRQTGADFKRPSNLAEQFSRPAAHLHHPPRNQSQRILSSDKLEDSVQSLRSYLGRSLDNNNGVPLLTRRRAKHKEGDVDSVKRSKYAREPTDEDFRRHRSQRPHTNTPTRDQGIVKVNLPDEEEEAEIDEHCLDAKSSSRDDGYHSVSQGDSCSFILGPRNWTPVNSQTPAEEVLQPKTPSVDKKKMVDKGSIDFEDSEDEGLDGEGIVVGFAQDSDDSDVEIIYSTGSHIEVPDNTLDTVEGFHSNDISVQTHSVKSLSPDLILSNHDNLSNKVTNEIQQEVKSAIVQPEIDSKQDIGEISGHNLINIKKNLSEYIQNESNLNVNNVVATDCDDIAYGSDPEFIASDGESVDDVIENEVKLIQNQKSISSQDESLGGVKPGSASSHKQTMSRASSMHSTFAHDDDQSSVTILPHDQDLISVDVKSAKSPTQSVSDQSIAQEHVGESQITDLIAPTAEAESQTLVKDTDSLATGDDVTSTVMSMGEDTTSVTQQLTDIHGDDEESRDKLGEIIDPRLPRDDRGRIEMIEIPHPTTPRSTDIATEDKVSPRPRSESSSKLGEKIEEDVDPETLVSIVEDKFAQKKAELPTMPTIPDYLKPKTQSKQQSKPQAKKDQKKKGQITKVKKEEKTTKTPADVSKAIDITSVQPEEQDEITQIIRKKVTLPPENEHSVMPDFVTEALNRSKERSRLQLEEEFAEKQRMIEKEIGNTSYEGEGMTVEELELEKKELKKREELAKEKLLKGKPQKKMDEKSKKSGGSSSVRSKKSKGGKDPLQMEKERIRALKEQEKLQRMEEIRALEEKIAAQSNSMSADDKKFKDKLQEVQMELERIEREAYMAEQTEADVRQALREERMKRMEEKAKLKKEELARKRQQLIDRKQQEKQLKEEARQRELQKIMMLMDDEERKKRQEEERLKKEEDEKEEEKKRKEMEEEFARQEREEEDRRRALEEEIEQEELRRIQVEQDEIRKQQEVVQAQKEALLEEQRRKRELAALEEQRQVEELDRKQQEELKRQAEERARINELLQLEEEVRERMKQDTEKRREEAIQRRDTNIDAKSNLNKIRHSQGINRAFVYSYFINWPMETYMRPIGEQEKKKKEAKLREKRKKAR